MTDDDLGRLAELLDGVAELRQRPKPTNRAKALFAKVLAGYSFETIETAVLLHLESEAGTYTSALQPAHIVAQIKGLQAQDGRLDSDEAWAIALASNDEHATVVWTDEIAAAAAIAHPILQTGDVVGARLAFRSAYQRYVQSAREVGKPVRWTPSLGHDPQTRQPALAPAVRLQQLSSNHAEYALPAPEVKRLSTSSAGPAPVTEQERLDHIANTQLKSMRELLARAKKNVMHSTTTAQEKSHEPSRFEGSNPASSAPESRRSTATAHALD